MYARYQQFYRLIVYKLREVSYHSSSHAIGILTGDSS